MVGISALIGAALAVRFNVFILVPTIIIVAAAGTAVVQVVRGDQAGSVAATIVLVVTALQISYLLGAACTHLLKTIHFFKRLKLVKRTRNCRPEATHHGFLFTAKD